MTELYGLPYNAEAAEAGVKAMREVMGQLAEYPPNGDEYVAAECKGMLVLDEEHEGFRALVRLFAHSRNVVPRITRAQPGMGPAEAVGILRAIYQDSMLNHSMGLSEAEQFPRGRDDPAMCIRDIEEILSDESRLAYFRTNLMRKDRRVQTNRASRYATVEIMGQLLGKTSLIDIGSGILQGPEQLYHKDRYPFAPVSIHTGNTKHAPRDIDATIRANELLKRSRVFRTLFANDIVSPYDLGTHTWTKASLRPTEMLNKEFMDRVDAFAEATLSDRNNPHPRIPFFEGDFTSEEEMAPLMEAVGDDDANKLDSASMITFPHQIGDLQQFDPDPALHNTIIGRARKLLRPDGVILVQDFVFERKNYLNFYADWRPGHYKMFALQMDDPRQRWQELFVALDVSQCRYLRLGKGSLYINGEYVPIRDALLNAP